MTNESPQDFLFSDESVPTTENGTLVVYIPANLQDEEALLAEYVRQLQFPSYFGWNWDAFNDCLGDLNWLDKSIQRVIIVHRDVPFSNDSGQRATYLFLLRVRLKEFPDSGLDPIKDTERIGEEIYEYKRLPVQVIFPRSAQCCIQE